ncbi:MAG: hypothetical protein V3V98_03710 [Thermoplasmata archaeon]
MCVETKAQNTITPTSSIKNTPNRSHSMGKVDQRMDVRALKSDCGEAPHDRWVYGGVEGLRNTRGENQ